MACKFYHRRYFLWGVILFFNTFLRSEFFQDHGLGKIDLFTNQTPYSMVLYSESRPLSDQLGADGSIVRLKTLKTGEMCYYRAVKDKSGIWRIYADSKDPGDLATQFAISHHEGKYIAFSSDVAEDFYLQSDPKTFEVFLKKEMGDNALWEIVEDPKCGDTLTVAHLKNKATGGYLISAIDTSGADNADDSSKASILNAEIKILKRQIEIYERVYPYITITYAWASATDWGTEGMNQQNIELLESIGGAGSFKKSLSKNIKGNILHAEGDHWVNDMIGAPTVARGRLLIIRYTEYLTPEEMQKGISNEKEVRFNEGRGSNPDSILHIEADVSKHPATPLKAELAVKTKEFEKLKAKLGKDVEIKKILLSDIGKTGYDGKPSILNQSSKNSIETVLYISNEIDSGVPKETAPGFSTLKSSVWAHRNPEIVGHGRYKLEKVSSEMVVTLNPLYSKGFAWIDESLPIPGKGTIVFNTLSSDGDVFVCFSEDTIPQSIYKIGFGVSENTQAAIYKNGEIVQSINFEQNKNVRVIPGMIEKLWVSLNNGLIMMGKGDPGTNIIMAWQDPSPANNIVKVGFSTFESEVKINNIQKLPSPIVAIAPERAYVKDSRAIQVGSGDAPVWHTLPLSPADSGTVVFEAKGSEEATLFLGNASNEGYKITFGAEGNTAALVERLKDGQDLYKIDAGMLPQASLKSDVVNKFWVSFYKGLMVIGGGDVGQNTFCCFVDSVYPRNISKVGFGGKSFIQNLEIWPEVQLGFGKEGSAYAKNTPSSTSLTIISPYDYKIMQEGPAVRFRDMLTGTQFQVNGTPAPDSDYHFKVDVLESGLPKITLLYQDPSEEKAKMEKAVKVLEMAAETTFKAAQTLAQATNAEVYSSLGVIAATAGVALAAAGLKVLQQAFQGKLDEYEAAANRYIFKEDIQRMVGGSGQVITESLQNRQIFEKKLVDMIALDLTDPIKLDYAVRQWQDIVRLITDFYVVSDPSMKSKFINGLSSIYDNISNIEITDSTMLLFQIALNTLIEAYNNPYLTGLINPEDLVRRDKWYDWISDIASKLLASSVSNKFGMPIKFKGEYFWYPVQFSSPASGSVTFEVKASQDIFVGFSEAPGKVRNLNNRIYEIVLGKWNNKLTAIHRKSLGDAVAEFDHKKLPNLSPDPTTFKKYWINIDKGVISCGVGSLGQSKQFEWKDPYPMPAISYVGFSNWNREILIKNVKVGPSIATLAKRSVFKKVGTKTIKTVPVKSSVTTKSTTQIVGKK